MNWHSVYDLRDDAQYLASMQRASQLSTFDFGLSLEPALVGSPEWWSMIADGRLESHTLEGQISRVYWGSMGDWPEFELTSSDGETSTWTRRARPGERDRFVEGLRARLAYAVHPWKRPGVLGPDSKVVLWIDIEDSDQRFVAKAPGLEGLLKH